MAHDHELEAEPGPARAEDALEEYGDDEEDVEDEGLHSVESDVVGETRVSHHAEVEGEEGDEAGVGNGVVEGEDWEDGLEEDGEGGVLGEEESAVLEAVEEREAVPDGGD